MTNKVSNKISTTQIAGFITIALTVFNAVAQNSTLNVVVANEEQVLALSTLLAPVIPAVYMMWRRTKKSLLKWGIFK